MSPTRSVLVAVAIITLSIGCQSQVAPTDPKTVGDGWESMFNGKDLTNWTPKIRGYPLGENFNNTFRVEEGLLTVAYEAYEKFDRRFGHLFYKTEYSSYDMELEYRFRHEQSPGGPGWAFRNNGIMIHGQSAKSMRKNQEFPVSIEVQLLGGNGEKDRTTANLCTPGTHVVMKEKLVKRHCIDSKSKTYHGDQWVKVRIEVRGHESIKHFVNGNLVMEYQKPQLDPRDKDAKTLIAKAEGKIELKGGSISLQAESHDCQFRNLRIKKIER